MHSRRNSVRTRQTVGKKTNLTDKIRSIPVAQRAIFYLCFMTLVGGVYGEVVYRIESQTCSSNDNCWTIDPTERRIVNLELGATLGLFLGTVISVPAIVNDLDSTI